MPVTTYRVENNPGPPGDCTAYFRDMWRKFQEVTDVTYDAKWKLVVKERHWFTSDEYERRYRLYSRVVPGEWQVHTSVKTRRELYAYVFGALNTSDLDTSNSSE